MLHTVFSVKAQYLKVPQISNQKPKAGVRVKVVPKAYKNTGLYYSLYLPENYIPNKKYPVIVEYTGNKHAPTGSTGKVKDANLGYAIAKKIEAIWVVFPYVKKGESILNWWGNEEETIEFAMNNIKDICLNYGGNPAEVFICGFSRGAIGVNYLGLRNKEIADTWLGFFSHDQYDGVKQWAKWGTPLSKYREEAKERFMRIKGRNCYISQKGTKSDYTFATKEYIIENKLESYANIQFEILPISSVIPNIPTNFVPHNHTDKWLLFDSKYANKVYTWFLKTIKNKPNTYTVSGIVKNSKGNPVSGVFVESGRTHFAITNKKGEYVLEGLISGKRIVRVKSTTGKELATSRSIDVKSNVTKLNFISQTNFN